VTVAVQAATAVFLPAAAAMVAAMVVAAEVVKVVVSWCHITRYNTFRWWERHSMRAHS
jgi:hypothetical protein